VRLLVDENLASHDLMARLRKAGHHVETPARGMLDEEVWRYAQAQRLALLTADPIAFEALSVESQRHSGLLVVYGERDRLKQMRAADVAGAIAHVREVHGDDLAARRFVLNEWRRGR